MHVNLRVGETSSGTAAFEPVHVLPLDERRYRVEFTPGLAYGLAAGDEIELADDGTYEVVARAGNVAVRVLSSQSLVAVEPNLTSLVAAALGGRLDGSIERGLAYTIPVGAGFSEIELQGDGCGQPLRRALGSPGTIRLAQESEINRGNSYRSHNH